MTLPTIVFSSIEIAILEKEIRNGPLVGNIHNNISIHCDGNIGIKEMFVDPTTVMFHKKVLRQKLFENYFEFLNEYPEDAKLVREYLLKEGIYPSNWMDKDPYD